MKSSFKLISLILAVIMLISGSLLIVSATADPNEAGGDDPVSDDTPADTDPVDTPADTDPVDTPADTDPVDTPADTDPVEQPADTDPVETPQIEDTPDDGYDGETDYEEPVQYEEDPIAYGDNSDYDYNSGDNDRDAGSVSDSTSLIATSGTKPEDVAPNKWSKITLDVNSKDVEGGFGDIKKDTSTENNGKWLLLLGYTLIALSVLGIMYFVVATISARKHNRRERRHNTDTSSSTRKYTSIDKESIKPTKRTGSSGHYADGFDSSASSRRFSRTADTGEIYVPRRAK